MTPFGFLSSLAASIFRPGLFPIILVIIIGAALVALLFILLVGRRLVKSALLFLVIDPEAQAIQLLVGREIVPGVYKAGDYIGFAPVSAPRYTLRVGNSTHRVLPLVAIGRSLYPSNIEVDTVFSYMLDERKAEGFDLPGFIASLATLDSAVLDIELSPRVKAAIYIDPKKLFREKLFETDYATKQVLFSVLQLAMGREAHEKLIEKLMELSSMRIRELGAKWMIILVLVLSVMAFLVLFFAK